MMDITETAFLTWAMVFLAMGFVAGFATRALTVDRERDESFRLGFETGRARERSEIRGRT